MDDVLYESCLRYFTSLANFGFKSELDVKKLLFYVFIQELVDTTSIVITEENYRHLENALYCMYGTTCLMPYPDYCERPMYAHLGDILELSARMAVVEDKNDEQDIRLDNHDTDITNIKAKNVRQDERLNTAEGRLDTAEGRLDNIDTLNTQQNERLTNAENRITGTENRLTSTEDRITIIENTEVTKDEDPASNYNIEEIEP